jgi:hypothetical protein
MARPSVRSLARSASQTVDPAEISYNHAQARNPETQQAAWEPEPGTVVALERGVSPQGGAEDGAVVRIDAGGHLQDVACG